MSPNRGLINRELIDLFIVGAQKSGTTSLKNYLGEHPQINTHFQKEFAFFYDDKEYAQGETKAFRKYFSKLPQKNITIAKNAGLYVKETAVARLKDHNPDCILVVILRNPVERAYSAFQMERNYGNFSGQFEDLRTILTAADTDDWRYEFFIKMGMYAQYLQTIYKYFPREQVLLYRFEDLCDAPKKICTELFTRLNVDASFEPDTSVKHNVTHNMRSSGYAKFVKRLLHNNNPIKKVARTILPSQQDYKLGEMMRNINKSSDTPQRMSPEMRTVLTEFYAQHNDELSKLTGIDFNMWSSHDYVEPGK